MISSEWGTPNMVKDGVNPELLLGGKDGHQLHIWDLKSRKHQQTLDLGADQQMTLVLLPVHNPTRAYGFVCSVISLTDLSSSVWMWYLDKHEHGNGKSHGKGEWKIRKVITIPAEPASPDDLPPLLKGFKAVPPLITDINLSLDDRYLYVSCWGTGELRQYDVSDPFNPVFTGLVKLGGIVNRTLHPASPSKAHNGGPQMVEVSRDGKRLYLTNALYTPWDEQFYRMCTWLDDEARREAWRRHQLRREVLPRVPGGTTPAPGAPPGRRRDVRLVLFRITRKTRKTRKARKARADVQRLLDTVAVASAVGAVHGVNPEMGWLFAVASGCRSAPRARCGVRCCRWLSVTRWRSARRSCSPRSSASSSRSPT